MFFLHTLEGLYRDLSLEEMMHRKYVPEVNRHSRARKLIHGEVGTSEYSPDTHTIPYAEKSYREAMKTWYEREPIFHAWQIMSSPVKTITPEINITDAWKLFIDEGIRHMPVVSDDKTIVGILSDRDLLKRLIITGNQVTGTTDETVADVMTHEVVTAARTTDIRRIAMAMFTMHIGTMPILDENRLLAGIITRSDILHALITYPPLRLWG